MEKAAGFGWTPSFSEYATNEIHMQLCHCHGFQASIKSIHHVALDEVTLNLAIAAEDGITIQKPAGRKGIPEFLLESRSLMISLIDIQWSINCLLPQPRGVRLLEVAEVTSLAWLPASNPSLLVSYFRYGILYCLRSRLLRETDMHIESGILKRKSQSDHFLRDRCR
jgi:hypothetical protein